MKTLVHINTHIIRSNMKNGTHEPPVTIRRGRKRQYAQVVEILGPSKVVYSPDQPLDCGARVWIETDSEVRAVA